jgi:hypothetical protein
MQKIELKKHIRLFIYVVLKKALTRTPSSRDVRFGQQRMAVLELSAMRTLDPGGRAKGGRRGGNTRVGGRVGGGLDG